MTAQDIFFKGTESYKGLQLPKLDCEYKSIDKFNLRLIWDPKIIYTQNESIAAKHTGGE